MNNSIRMIIGTATAALSIGGWSGCGKTAATTSPAAPAEAKRAGPAMAAALHLASGGGGQNKMSTAKVKKAPLARDLATIGSVTYDADHYAVVGPLISGRIVSVRVGSGDKVRRGQVLAEVESAEVGQAQAAYLQASAKAKAAETNLRRERELAAQRVSSDRERELAEAQFSSDRAFLHAARQRLASLGLKPSDISQLADRSQSSSAAGRVAIRSPLEGVVIARDVTLGQAVQAATDAFKVADLSRLWVNLDVYEKDLAAVQVGQKAVITAEGLPGRVFRGRVAYVEPQIDEQTRTARVRIELVNDDLALRAGQFVTAKLLGDPTKATRVVLSAPKTAVLTVEGKAIVFIKRPDGDFERRDVKLGMSGGGQVEIERGLAEGEEVVSEGAFLLKSELLR